MGHRQVQRLTLLIVGSVATFVGSAILVDPVGFHAAQGIQVTRDAGLLNEMRAAGTPILSVGVVALIASSWSKLSRIATVSAAILFLGYGLARLLGFALDGVSDSRLVFIAGFELAVGLTCTFLALKAEVVSTRRL